jgi:hypothetical protein
MRGHLGGVRQGFVTSDGRQVVSASQDGSIRWWWLRGELTAEERASLHLDGDGP